MTYFDPLLDELKAARQYRSPIAQYGQQLAQANIPTQSGQGFWKNLAAQIIPDLLGAGLTYAGQQQEESRYRESAAQLLPILEKTNMGDIVGSLKSAGRDDLAAQILMASQEAEMMARAREAEKEADWIYEERKMNKDFENKKVLEGIKSAGIGSRAAQRDAATLGAARIMAEAQLTGKARDIEREFLKATTSNPDIGTAKKATQYISAVNATLDAAKQRGTGKLTGAEFLSLLNSASRVNSDEALSDASLEMIANTSGLSGQIALLKGRLVDGGDVPIDIAEKIASAANQTYAGKMAASQALAKELARSYQQIARGLPITELEALIAKPVIKTDFTQGKQPVQMPKQTESINKVPAGAKEGDIVIVNGQKFRVAK